MSPENEKVNKHLSKIETMTPQELTQLLQQDLEADPGLTADEILAISQELLRREPEAGPELTPQQSWQNFKAKQPRKTRCRPRRIMLIAAALAGALSFSLMAGATGGNALRSVVGAWDVFGFYYDSTEVCESAPPLTMGSVEDPRWQTLVQTNYAPGLTPAQLPEGFQLSNVHINDASETLGYFADYRDGDRVMSVNVKNFDDSRYGRLSVTGEPLELYCHDDVIYYIFACNERYVVTWFSDGYECDVAGDITLEEARQIIQSVQAGRDNNDEKD